MAIIFMISNISTQDQNSMYDHDAKRKQNNNFYYQRFKTIYEKSPVFLLSFIDTQNNIIIVVIHIYVIGKNQSLVK